MHYTCTLHRYGVKHPQIDNNVHKNSILQRQCQSQWLCCIVYHILTHINNNLQSHSHVPWAGLIFLGDTAPIIYGNIVQTLVSLHHRISLKNMWGLPHAEPRCMYKNFYTLQKEYKKQYIRLYIKIFKSLPNLQQKRQTYYTVL